jgi:hypothetical protein
MNEAGVAAIGDVGRKRTGLLDVDFMLTLVRKNSTTNMAPSGTDWGR